MRRGPTVQTKKSTIFTRLIDNNPASPALVFEGGVGGLLSGICRLLRV